MDGVTNPHLWESFDHGEFHEAIQGLDDHFVAGVTFREDHDLLLVLRVLIHWADDRQAWPAALAAVEKALASEITGGDSWRILHLAWAAVLVGDNEYENLLTERAVSDLLVFMRNLTQDDQSREIADLLSERYSRPPGWYHRNTTNHERADWGQVRWWDGLQWSTRDS